MKLTREVPKGRRGDAMLVQWVHNGFRGRDEREIYALAEQLRAQQIIQSKLRKRG